MFGPRATDFVKELGHRLRQVSGEANSFAYLTQRLCSSMLGTMKVDNEDEEFFCVSIVLCFMFYVLCLS